MAKLILLPGLACDGDLWQDVVPRLDAHHQVELSDVHARHDSLAQMGTALLDAHDGPRVLVGSSMGGMVALQAALHDIALRERQPAEAPGPRVVALALLGSSARADTAEMITLRRQACELYAAGRMDEVLRANVPFAFDAEQARDAGLVQRYVAMIRRAGADALIRQNRAVMARPDLRPQLARIACPALVVCGAADLLTPPEHAREMAALLPQARLEIVERCGHLLTLEQPAVVAALLNDWLATLPPFAASPSPAAAPGAPAGLDPLLP